MMIHGKSPSWMVLIRVLVSLLRTWHGNLLHPPPDLIEELIAAARQREGQQQLWGKALAMPRRCCELTSTDPPSGRLHMLVPLVHQTVGCRLSRIKTSQVGSNHPNHSTKGSYAMYMFAIWESSSEQFQLREKPGNQVWKRPFGFAQKCSTL